MKVYIASGWFNKEQTRDLEDIKMVVKAHKLDMFSPKDECICPPDADIITQTNVFHQNLDAIYNCDFIIVNTRDKDMGSIFEAGYAKAKKKPIIYFCRELRGPFNLMLSRSGIAVATDISELYNHISEFIEDQDYITYYDGRIE